MFALYETPAGFALFKVLDEKAIDADVSGKFGSIKEAQKIVKLHSFHKFKNTQEAVEAATAIVESKVGKTLKKFLKKEVGKKSKESLAVCDKMLGSDIKSTMSIPCIYNASVTELFRGIRSQLNALLGDATSDKVLSNMSLGLSHSLSRYKLKFSPDKVDTMIVQAVNLLDDLDKELNIYAMRVKEWYGWHFPEMAKIVPENLPYAKIVLKLQNRNNASSVDLSDIIPEEMEKEIKDLALISMGTEISDYDLIHVTKLAKEVLSISSYRTELYDYLTNRMQAIAPNITHLVGELVGARLIAHAGSLLNLAKHPSSTVQILGAEKALFRALKAKHNTPKYGILYHAALVGQAPQKYKGKVARSLAAKCAMSARVDALGDSDAATIAIDGREKVEERIQKLESTTGKEFASKTRGYSGKQFGNNGGNQNGNNGTYNESNDVTSMKFGNKRGRESNGDDNERRFKKKKY